MIHYEIKKSTETYPQWSNPDKLLAGLTIAFFGLGIFYPGFLALAAITDTAVLGRRIGEFNKQKKIYN